MARTVRLRPSTAAIQEILRIRTTCGALQSGHTPGQLPDPQLLPFSVKGSSLDPETQERSCEHVRAVGGAGFQTVSCPPHPRAWGNRPPGQSCAPHPLCLGEKTPGTVSCPPQPGPWGEDPRDSLLPTPHPRPGGADPWDILCPQPQPNDSEGGSSSGWSPCLVGGPFHDTWQGSEEGYSGSLQAPEESWSPWAGPMRTSTLCGH